jgi:hypothetical protein
MKLAIALASLSLSIAAPVFACPMEEHDSAARTAEKAKAKDGDAKETAKTDADKAKPAEKAKPADRPSRPRRPSPATRSRSASRADIDPLTLSSTHARRA